MAKFLSPRKRIGQLGVNLIERIVLRMGHKFEQLNAELDTGTDGIVEILNLQTGEATNYVLLVQSRSRQTFTAETETSFEYLCDERDLCYWRSGNAPVLLIVSRSDSDEAYWVEVKSYFADPKRLADRRVRFDKTTSRFDPSCGPEIAKLAVPRDIGLYFAPPPVREDLISNLFKVISFPQQVFVADTDARGRGEIWARAKELGVRLPGGEWFLKAHRLVSVHNLREQPWQHFVDLGTAESFDAGEWSRSDKEEQTWDYSRLLRLCLRERLWPWGVTYSESLRFFYFFATWNLKPRRIQLPTSTRPRTVFNAHASRVTEGKVSFYRHLAFWPDFYRVEDEWWLGVNPTYHYTRDGRLQSRFAGDLAQGVKKLERNNAVLGQLLFWSYILTTDAATASPLFHPDQRPYSFLRLEAPERFLSEQGIDDIAWLKREERERAEAMAADQHEPELF